MNENIEKRKAIDKGVIKNAGQLSIHGSGASNTSEQQKAAKRARDAARYQQKKAKMSEDEYAMKRAKDAESKRLKRMSMSEEEAAMQNAKNAKHMKEQRTSMTQEEAAMQNAKDAARMKEQRTSMTQDEAAMQNAKDAARMKEQRASMTQEEHAERKKKNAEGMRLKRQNPFYLLREAKTRKYARLSELYERSHRRNDRMYQDALERFDQDIFERTWTICRTIELKDPTQSFHPKYIRNIASAISDAAQWYKKDWQKATTKIMRGPIFKAGAWHEILKRRTNFPNIFWRLRATIKRKYIKKWNTESDGKEIYDYMFEVSYKATENLINEIKKQDLRKAAMILYRYDDYKIARTVLDCVISGSREYWNKETFRVIDGPLFTSSEYNLETDPDKDDSASEAGTIEEDSDIAEEDVSDGELFEMAMDLQADGEMDKLADEFSETLLLDKKKNYVAEAIARDCTPGFSDYFNPHAFYNTTKDEVDSNNEQED